jgi:hypothetical protein
MSNEVANTVTEVAETVAATAAPAQKVANSAVKAVHTTVGVAKRFSPQILMGVGIAGVITAGVLACKATLRLEEVVTKAEDDIEDVKERRTENKFDTETEYNKELTKVYVNRTFQIVKLYTPALSVGMVGIGCLLGSYGVMNQRNVASIAAYQTLASGFEKYRRNVVEDLGEEKDKEYRYGLVEKDIPTFDEEGKQTGSKTVVDVRTDGHSDYFRIFEGTNDNWSKVPGMNQMFLTNQQNWLNDRLNARGYLFLNDVYKSLGYPATPAGQSVGWLSEGHRNFDPKTMDGFVDFGLMEIEQQNKRDFQNAFEHSVIIDFNVDGFMQNLI